MEEQLKKIFCGHGAAPERLTVDARLRLDLDLDSFEMMQLAIELEEMFDIAISSEALIGFATFGDVLRFVAAAKKNA